MAAANKFNILGKYTVDGTHQYGVHTFKWLLTNTAPSAANQVRGDLTEISAGNGYVAGGPVVAITTAQAVAIGRATAVDVTLTASGGSIGPFRYAVLYNDTVASPVKPLVGWWDYGSAITILAGESFIFDADGVNGILQAA